MIKNLTNLKWRKNVYYISNDIIFDIESKKKKFDIDCCSSYLVDIDSSKADGMIVDLQPEAYIDKVPYIVAEFITDSERTIKRYFPLQYLIEEGDKVVDGKVVQSHPDVFDNKYINKFNQEIFDYIKGLLKGKDNFDLRNVQLVMNSLPFWLSPGNYEYMTEEYIDKSFLKGSNYNQGLATRGDSLFKVNSIKLGIGEDLYSINIWSEDVVLEVVKAIYAEKFINKYGNAFKYLTFSTMERIANNIKNAQVSNLPKSLSTFLNITYNNGECESVSFESLCADSNIDTYYEYKKANDTSKYYALINDEESYNSNTVLEQYYAWSDQENAPAKEDLWNTTEQRVATIADAQKEQGTDNYILDDNGNYIYENCERCWEGAVNADGAKYPKMTVEYTGELASTITFKYTYPNGTVKEVNPWGNDIFGGNPNNPRKTWGVVSLPTIFEDNDFLIDENRNDEGHSTFDISRFEMILNPID